MNNEQVTGARRALNLHKTRIRVRMSVDGEDTTITPYLISSPETEGASVVVTHDVTPPRDIERQLLASMEALNG